MILVAFRLHHNIS